MNELGKNSASLGSLALEFPAWGHVNQRDPDGCVFPAVELLGGLGVGVDLHGPARAFRQHSRTVQRKPRETRALTEPSPSVGTEPWLGSHQCCFPESDPFRRAATTEAHEKATE